MLMTFQNLVKPEFNIATLNEFSIEYIQISAMLVLPLFAVVFVARARKKSGV